jgi:putative lysine transport system substrate-binding protein
MKRKLIGVILMAVMVCSLAACGSKETKETKADADKSGTPVLRVAMECGYAPYNWTQSDDSNGAVPIEDSKDYAYGYDVMMAKKIADKLGCELQIVKLDWDSLIPAVQSGTVDCVIAGQSITSDRKEMVDFTEPYYYASIVTLVKSDGKYADAKGISDLAGARQLSATVKRCEYPAGTGIRSGNVSSIREWPYRFSSNRYSDSKSSMCCLSGSEDFRFYRYR